MEAKENYDLDSVTLLDAGTQSPAFSLDPMNLACGYDFNRRLLTYLGTIIPGVNNANGHFTNSTGFTLYDGSVHVIAPGATLTLPTAGNALVNNFSPQVLQKSIDTGEITVFSTYDATVTVPANVGCTFPFVFNKGHDYTTASITVSGGGGTGMVVTPILDAGGGGYLVNAAISNWGTGFTSSPTFTVVGDGASADVRATSYLTPSDGSYRWVGANFSCATFTGPNGPNLINPYNRDFWTSAESCELYQFRLEDNFAQTLAPAVITTQSSPFLTPVLYPTGIDATWCYALCNPVVGGVHNAIDLALVPAAITAAEVTAASKLTYVIWDTAPFSVDWGARLTFGTAGDVYVFSSGVDGSNKFYWRLTKYVPPVLGTFGANLPGTMTDLTPALWDTAGPNADAVNYSASDYAGSIAGSCFFTLCRLPASNRLAAVLTMPKEASSDPTDYTKTLFSCVYVTLGATPTYEYHSGFVTGFMDSDWQSVDVIPTVGYAVVACRETNNYLEQSDYVYGGVDYTTRVFVFQCYPISGGMVDTSNGLMAVLVAYQFTAGSAPAVVALPGVVANTATDPDWSVNYPDYQTAISQNFAVYNSMMTGTAPTLDLAFLDADLIYPDPALYDRATNAVWCSGVANQQGRPGDLDFNNMFYLDDAFTPRAAFNASGQNNNKYGPITPPFLRLTFPAVVPPAPGSGRRSAKVTLRYGKAAVGS